MNVLVSRRLFVGGVLAAALDARGMVAQSGKGRPMRVLLGTMGKVSKGIYTASFDSATGVLGPMSLAAEVKAPTFLAEHHAKGEHLVYAVSEVEGAGAQVSAWTSVAGSTMLKELNAVPTEGNGPTHLSLTPDGRCLAVANYGGGSFTSYHVEEDGRISQPVSHVQYTGSGPDKERQAAPHAHSTQFSPDGKFLLVNDLGLDRINVYRVNGATGAVTPNDPPYWAARPATGPRHIAFHPNGKWLYSVNELDSTVDQLHWDAAHGVITPVDHVSTLKAGFPAHTAFAGEILLSHDGRHLYVGNRVGEDSIAVFDIDAQSGALKLVQLAPNGGKNTRHIALDPTGRWMLLSDQNSSAVVVLERDGTTGHLSEPKHTYPLDTVMFALFV